MSDHPSPQQHQSTALTLVDVYCVAGEFGFPAGFGAEPVAGPTWTASPFCNVSGGLSITGSCGDRPAVTSTVSPKSRPSWITLRATVQAGPLPFLTQAVQPGPKADIEDLPP